MIFQYTIGKVLAGTKTQTRRLMLPTDMVYDFSYEPYAMPVYPYHAYQSVTAVLRGNRPVWRIRHSYAVQPARGAKAIARIKIIAIRHECVSAISEQDATAEGFASRADFLATWQTISKKHTLNVDVWALTFELVEAVQS